MLDTWYLTDEDTRKFSRQVTEKTQEAQQQGYELFAIGNPENGKIIAVLAQGKQQGGRSDLPHILTEGI